MINRPPSLLQLPTSLIIFFYLLQQKKISLKIKKKSVCREFWLGSCLPAQKVLLTFLFLSISENINLQLGLPAVKCEVFCPSASLC